MRSLKYSDYPDGSVFSQGLLTSSPTGEGENVRSLALCECFRTPPPFALTSILSRWERRPLRPRLSEDRARDRSVEHEDLQTGAETDSLSQRERVSVGESAT